MKRFHYVYSVIGLLVLFIAFLMYQMPSIPAWGTVKLTDVMMIVGGLLFIVPIYVDSLRRKGNDGAPNRWVWATLPLVGMAVVCVGILIPNSIGFLALFPLADVFYLVGCLLILPVFVYPPFDLNREELEEEIEEMEERMGA
ncbi:permease [Bifidobacterium phasiani]|uniref:Permease n=1 Tax=Bifidobacterium phasiani TaxID=2834431 RepID=A0ABS6W9H7_9BIFI|nr:permease [Bifidobacterium phasiani]MBW3083158.1 permease [Bifidobacterium phasiani]